MYSVNSKGPKNRTLRDTVGFQSSWVLESWDKSWTWITLVLMCPESNPGSISTRVTTSYSQQVVPDSHFISELFYLLPESPVFRGNQHWQLESVCFCVCVVNTSVSTTVGSPSQWRTESESCWTSDTHTGNAAPDVSTHKYTHLYTQIHTAVHTSMHLLMCVY